MKRVLIFALLFPLLALVVFVAPEVISKRAIPAYFWDSIPFAYLAAMVPALLLAALDRVLSAHPTYFRIGVTAAVGALISGAIAAFFWDGFHELWPAIMALLVGGIPGAVCSGLAHE